MVMRQIRAEIGVVAKADGSAMFEMGNTKVVAAVYGPREVQNRSQQLNANALVRCEYTMANFSTGDRMRKLKGDRRSTEISLVIRQTMEECILTNLMPRSQIDIFVQVVQADGGTLSACINAATLALANAGIPMRDIVTSCSAGYLNSTPLLDLNYIEDSAGGADVTLGIMPKLDKVTLLQMDAKLSLDTFENVMQLAIEGCKAVADYIREVSAFHFLFFFSNDKLSIVDHVDEHCLLSTYDGYYWRTQSNCSIVEEHSFIAWLATLCRCGVLYGSKLGSGPHLVAVLLFWILKIVTWRKLVNFND
ncbi:putative exosome complex component Rrp42, archaea, PNPase/RNase PH domain-containing protein [Rosa chinensis]|uniref:Putative exosome complex component Rrp42, archaea, PNPase/RNase PH domain-containing protein n=1 Tax=Rosa chinensis TaxID=74649 RepID=A0A2P6PR06_ROSCH|nr:putative exosome complex component Rrp42, archaea, PNPase/RNase PH domain-containing protein [Rosa chinensis]